MTTGDPCEIDIRRRRALLEELRIGARQMIDELADVIGIAPRERLHEAPSSALDQVVEFCRGTDFAAATDDGRAWMRNRLGVYVTRYFIVRYGGSLELQEDPARKFYLHYVVTGMELPIAPGARLDSFAIAHDVVDVVPKAGLAESIHAAERSLLAQAPDE